MIDGFRHKEFSRWYEYDPQVFNDSFSRFGKIEEDYNSEAHSKKTVNLFKLHGSLDWKLTYNNLIVRELSQGRVKESKQFKDNLLIYPAEKHEPTNEPFKSLHEWFKRFFKDADTVIFIGFAFRDPYLNKIIFNDEKSRGKKLILVSRNARKRTIELESELSQKIIPMDADFGKDEVPVKVAEVIKD